MKRKHWSDGVVIGIIFTCLVFTADARNPFLKEFFKAYPSAKNSVLDTVPSNSGHCGVCHFDFSGGGPRNPYGLAVEGTPNRNKDDILSLGALDSDGDGFSNTVEITDTGTPDPWYAAIRRSEAKRRV